MITIKKGNIFTTQCDVIVNTVNCVGVMGAGIAFEFKLRYPEMYHYYKKHCDNGHIKIGNLWLYNDVKQIKPCGKVLNFPTKNHWKDASSLNYLKQGLEKFLATYKHKSITSIAFPLLGASLGGLSEKQVLSTMTYYLEQADIDIEIWYFDAKAKDDLFDDFNAKFNQLNELVIKKQSGLGISAINKIKAALNQSEINSLGSLLGVKGIGKTSLEKSFAFIKQEEIVEPENLSLFD